MRTRLLPLALMMCTVGTGLVSAQTDENPRSAQPKNVTATQDTDKGASTHDERRDGQSSSSKDKKHKQRMSKKERRALKPANPPQNQGEDADAPQNKVEYGGGG
jgi:hypothetical protein